MFTLSCGNVLQPSLLRISGSDRPRSGQVCNEDSGPDSSFASSSTFISSSVSSSSARRCLAPSESPKGKLVPTDLMTEALAWPLSCYLQAALSWAIYVNESEGRRNMMYFKGTKRESALFFSFKWLSLKKKHSLDLLLTHSSVFFCLKMCNLFNAGHFLQTLTSFWNPQAFTLWFLICHRIILGAYSFILEVRFPLTCLKHILSMRKCLCSNTKWKNMTMNRMYASFRNKRSILISSYHINVKRKFV